MSRAKQQRVADYLQHILQAIDNILLYTSGMDKAAFLTDRKTQDAVVRNLEIVGEACRNVSIHHPEFAREQDQVPWSFAYEMRNALAHGYFTVDYNIVWQTIQTDLPLLRRQVAAIG